MKELGALDILVNALDAPLYAPAEAADDSAFDKVIEGNLKTVWMACQEGGARDAAARRRRDRQHHLGARRIAARRMPRFTAPRRREC